MIKRKNISLIAVIIIILVSFNGCGKRLDGKEIVRYMEKKYDEKFTYVDVTGGQLGGKSLTLRLEPEKYPGEIILARCELKKDGDKTWKKFNDNYMGLVFENEIREKLTRISEEVYSECKVFYSRNEYALLPVEIGPHTKIEEYISSKSIDVLTISLFLSNKNELAKKDEQILNLVELLKKNKIVCSIDLAYLIDDEAYNKIETWEEAPNTKNDYYIKESIVLNDDYTYKKYEWE